MKRYVVVLLKRCYSFTFSAMNYSYIWSMIVRCFLGSVSMDVAKKLLRKM